jgi:TatD DNase family protein
MLADTHAHLNMKEFDPDRESVLERAADSGVEWILDVGTDLESSRKAVREAACLKTVFAAAGVHPHAALAVNPSVLSELETLLSSPKVKALGEIGLDYHYDFSPRSVQRDAFRAQLEMALSRRMPVIIHVREAMADALDILHAFSADGWEGVFHCFSGNSEDASRLIRMGFHISFTGVVTFPNFGKFDAVRQVPLNRLLLETDAPYMTPVPHRGKRNEPAFLTFTAAKLSEILGVEPNFLAAQTTRNALTLFRLEP